jgi:hypothetical protein
VLPEACSATSAFGWLRCCEMSSTAQTETAAANGRRALAELLPSWLSWHIGTRISAVTV